jgi:hypothetical protein
MNGRHCRPVSQDASVDISQVPPITCPEVLAVRCLRALPRTRGVSGKKVVRVVTTLSQLLARRVRLFQVARRLRVHPQLRLQTAMTLGRRAMNHTRVAIEDARHLRQGR